MFSEPLEKTTAKTKRVKRCLFQVVILQPEKRPKLIQTWLSPGSHVVPVMYQDGAMTTRHFEFNW